MDRTLGKNSMSSSNPTSNKIISIGSAPQTAFKDIIGQSSAMKAIFRMVEKVAGSDTTIMLNGETGTGKGVIARAIHECSPRRSKPLIQINCGATPEGLLESEFFGYRRGAFTGAVADKPGKFEMANGGTIFLDEIGDMSTDLQVKVLRVLEEGEFERIGGRETIKVDARIIAATHRDLEEEVQKGHFREDLFYRLYVIPILLPPMRAQRLKLATPEAISDLLAKAAAGVKDHKFTPHFLWAEWNDVVDAWQLKTWDAYRDVQRLGRKTRLSERQRTLLWTIFDNVRVALAKARMTTLAEMFSRSAERIKEYQRPPFDFAVIDEAQDVGVAELRFLAALGGARPNSLFFAGDLGQRIFQQPFSWKSLGVDIRGRSHTLKINYRTSHQIRRHADRLLPAEIADVDGNVENRRGAISVFEGAPPTLRIFEHTEAETAGVGKWLSERLEAGLKPHEIGVFVRSSEQFERALAAVKRCKAPAVQLSDAVETRSGHISVGAMHLAKGLEFRAVVVMACDDEVIPLQERIESVTDDSDLEDVYNTERHLLYVACTRARDLLLVSGVKPASEFLDDLAGKGHER